MVDLFDLLVNDDYSHFLDNSNFTQVTFSSVFERVMRVEWFSIIEQRINLRPKPC